MLDQQITQQTMRTLTSKNTSISPLIGFLLILILTAVTPAHAIRLLDAELLFEISDQLSQPSDVAVSSDGRIYIVDGVNNKIRIFNQNGQPLAAFGTAGSGNGEFNNPLGIDIGRSGRVYIADSGNHRVQIFDSEANFINDIKLPQKMKHAPDPTDVVVDEIVEKGELYRPKGVALDKNNRIYVSDSWLGVIQVFEPTGAFYAVLGDGLKRNVKRFKTPVGLFIDTRNRMYVVEMFANKVSVYRLGEAFISE
jgi:tripartite motif-containing protein 71